MHAEHLRLLRCPTCRAPFRLNGAQQITCSAGHSFPVVGGIPRFVADGEYADSFGFQWNRFSQVQLDSYNGSGFSAQRFADITQWTAADLANKRVLDAGCGAGRFAEVVAGFGAQLVAVDLSSAVEACQANLRGHNALVCQASLYELPFVDCAFDYVYCIGVIQHTPNPHQAIRALCRQVRPGGQIGLWIYELNWKAFVGTIGFKYALRPLTRRLSREAQWKLCQGLVNVFYPLVRLLRRFGQPGRFVTRLLPVCAAHLHHVALAPADLKSWVLLDTFDMYSPAYDQPQRFDTVARILQEEGFVNIQRNPHGAIAVTATRAG